MVAEAVYPLPRAVLTVFLAIGVHRVGASTVDHGVRRDSPPLPLNVSCRDSLPDDCAGKLENTAWALLDLAAIRLAYALTGHWVGPIGANPNFTVPDGRQVGVRAAAHTGMGDLLADASMKTSLAAACGLRHVFVDWRFSSYLTDKSANLFDRLFDQVAAAVAVAVAVCLRWQTRSQSRWRWWS